MAVSIRDKSPVAADGPPWPAAELECWALTLLTDEHLSPWRLMKPPTFVSNAHAAGRVCSQLSTGGKHSDEIEEEKCHTSLSLSLSGC